MKRRAILKGIASIAALGGMLGFAAPTFASVSQRYEKLKKPVPPEASGKIEVIEFFSYSCGHCYTLDPYIERWRKTLPADISFFRVATAFNAQWATYARIYYTLEAMDLIDKYHPRVFAAFMDENIRLTDETILLSWVGKQGIDATKFSQTLKSFGVQSRLQRANQLASAYKINGVPTMAVGGQFTTSASMAGGYKELLEVVDQLIVEVRGKA